MHKERVLNRINWEYPNKNVIGIESENPQEVIIEIEPTQDHPEYSKAIAVIDKSEPHFHKETTETYKVIAGQLTVYIDDQIHKLKEDDEIIIKPNQVHWVQGQETWVECVSEPGWTPEDHFLINTP
jgi:quercetin dioxygenase-like cupin family protein